MADANSKNDCPRCADLEARVASLEAHLAVLEAQLAAARKNSRNSSKPPSSDLVKPPKKQAKPGRKRKRKIGGQPGHERHLRTPFADDQIDRHWVWRYDGCPCCGGKLVDDSATPTRTLQQVELLEKPYRVEQHDAQPQRCAQCGETFVPELPEELRKAGLAGPRLTALVGFLKGPCNMTFSAIETYFRDVVGVRLSRGMLAKLVNSVSASLADPYEELLAMLPQEDRLNVDETGHKENGRRLWTWCFRALMFTVYKISPSRGSDVLLEVLGEEFNGALGCDYFSAYRKYMRLNENVHVQFCLAHLIRDVKFLAEHPDNRNQAHGERLLADLRKLFGVIHRREQYASAATFRRALEAARNDLVWNATMASPHTKEAAALEERFFRHTESYFQFIVDPELEPTNNLAEQALRHVAIQRRTTQGTRGESGRRWSERIWTTIQTCKQQGRSAYEYLCSAARSHVRGVPSPSLVPGGP